MVLAGLLIVAVLLAGWWRSRRPDRDLGCIASHQQMFDDDGTPFRR